MVLMKKLTLEKVFPWILIIGGVLGLLAASILMVEKIAVLKDPSHQLSCSINPVLSCGPIMNSDQASAFGFPNPILGLAMFPMVITAGTLLLAGAVRLKKWFWICFQLGTVFGIAFVIWLFSQSLYSIGALCIYCMVVWAVTIPIFWSTLAWNLRNKNFSLGLALNNLLSKYFKEIIALNYLVFIVLIVIRFSDYFKTWIK